MKRKRESGGESIDSFFFKNKARIRAARAIAGRKTNRSNIFDSSTLQLESTGLSF
jgi:hypothetical protein